VKANPAGGPFGGFNVRNVILAGCSEQGLIIRQYMRDAHPIYREADGSSIYDGYFPACVADWPSNLILINGVPFANFTQGPIEVPVINLTGQQEVEAWPQDGRKFRRPDGDLTGDKYRVYEIAGMGHGLSKSSNVCAVRDAADLGCPQRPAAEGRLWQRRGRHQVVPGRRARGDLQHRRESVYVAGALLYGDAAVALSESGQIHFEGQPQSPRLGEGRLNPEGGR